jgi:endonuclease III
MLLIRHNVLILASFINISLSLKNNLNNEVMSLSIKDFSFSEITAKAEWLRKKWNSISGQLAPEGFLAKNEFAPLIGTICDEQINSDDAWDFPEWLHSKIGTFELSKLLDVDYGKELEEFLKDKWPKGMRENEKQEYIKKTSKAIKDALNFFYKEKKTPVTMFENRPYKALEIYFMLRRIAGIGPKKANMITRDFIYRSLGITNSHAWFDQIKRKLPDFKVEDGNFLDMPIDIHVIKVFNRLFGRKYPSRKGWRSELPNHVQDILAFSKLAFPDLPIKLDQIFWTVGREYCHERNPDCARCLIADICESARNK